MSINIDALIREALDPTTSGAPEDWQPGEFFQAMQAEATRQARLLDESRRTPPNPHKQP